VKLIWLFNEYHVMRDQLAEQEKSLDAMIAQSRQLTKDNEALTTTLLSMQKEIQTNPSYMNGVMDLLHKYQEQVLQELPFPPGQEPEWLTHE
jgi:CHASE3 domain sensor protein